MNDSKKSGSGCLKGFVAGCLGCVGLVVLLGVGLWLSRDMIEQMPWARSLRHTFETAKTEASKMMALRTSLLADYPCDGVQIHVQANSTNGKSVKTLTVGLVNPSFEVPDGPDAKTALARKIAHDVARRYPGLARFDELRIAFVVNGGTGVKFSGTTNFDFPVTDLLSNAGSTPPSD